MNTIAKKLTLKEIETLPRGTVIWRGDVSNDSGIVWHGTSPAVICASGRNGYVVGGNEAGYFSHSIDDEMIDDPVYHFTFWDREPEDYQLPGISEDEYNAMTGEEKIMFRSLAEAITSKGMTIEKFAQAAALDPMKLWEALTGEREFEQWEMVIIRGKLSLSDEETAEVFFPETLAKI